MVQYKETQTCQWAAPMIGHMDKYTMGVEMDTVGLSTQALTKHQILRGVTAIGKRDDARMRLPQIGDQSGWRLCITQMKPTICSVCLFFVI